MSSERVPLPDLTTCDREPITRLDRIQNFGFLVALSNDWTVIRASANLGSHIGMDAALAIGGSFSATVDADAQTAIRTRTARLHSTGNERLFGIRLIADRPPFDLNLHFVDDILVIEGEPSLHDGIDDAVSTVRAMMAQLVNTPALETFQRIAARQVREITGFDRVMVYRFDAGGNGEVVAEATGLGIDSFLGLHYPATDIPQQARALYVRNPFRIISDVGETPVALLPAVGINVPALDLSQSITRAVSPIHIEYLTNMGVGATLSISIIVGGELWGLFACHHYGPRLPSFVMRTAAEMFGAMYSLTLESRLARSNAIIEQRARRLTDTLVAGVAGNENLLSDPEWLHSMISEVVEYDGIAVYRAGHVLHLGSAPTDEQVIQLTLHLNLTSPSRVFTTDYLTSLSKLDSADPDKAAGFLAIPISRIPRDYILLFRREWQQSIKWGGEPGKLAASEAGMRLSPRKSFAAFSEIIRGKSRPFTDSDRRIGEAMRSATIEVLLRLSNEILVINEAALEKLVAQRTAALRAEINTRRIMATAIAHELNQPLAAVSSYLNGTARLAERGDMTPDTLAMIAEGSRQAANNVIRAGNILKVLRKSITRDDTAMTDEDINSIISETIAMVLVDGDVLGIQFKFDHSEIGMHAMVNRTQIRQVLANLIQNAVEAVTGMVRREVMVTASNDNATGLLTVEVADTGPGVPPEQLAGLFTPFVSNKPHGMGIGLSISREIAEQHHGKLTTRANPGGGAIFSLVLPLSGVSTAATGTLQ